jgi:hypothetical protein
MFPSSKWEVNLPLTYNRFAGSKGLRSATDDTRGAGNDASPAENPMCTYDRSDNNVVHFGVYVRRQSD